MSKTRATAPTQTSDRGGGLDAGAGLFKPVAMGPNEVEDAAAEFNSRVQIVVRPAKGRSIGGCESRPRKQPEERGSKFSGVG